jgi:hypothetical protein
MNLKQDKTSGTAEAAHNGVMILQNGDLGCGWGCERVIDPRESTPAIRARGLSTLVQKSNAPTRRDRSSGLYSTLGHLRYCRRRLGVA